MLRRRRPKHNEAIHFSFDSFLDLVTNVVGIIIRLILVTWIGARSYHASMQWVQTEPSDSIEQLPPPKITDEPLYSRLEIARHEIEEAKARLTAQIKALELTEQKAGQTQAQLAGFAGTRHTLESERKSLEALGVERARKVASASLSVDEVRQRSRKLLDEIKALEAQPVRTKQLRYHAPLSRIVRSDEVFFECQNGQVTFIDLPAFQLDMKLALDGDIREELKTQWRVEHTTAPVGPYRLRYTVERDKSPFDGPTPSASSFNFGLLGWVVEPLTGKRGESLTQAMAPQSQFRQIVDPLDSSLAVVTFWVYPDSFEMFRRLRDYLYDRGIDVAGRPLPPGVAIEASRHGSASRGQ